MFLKETLKRFCLRFSAGPLTQVASGYGVTAAFQKKQSRERMFAVGDRMINAITGDYEAYLDPPTAGPSGASIDAAVVAGAHRVLTTYFTAPATVALLDDARDSDLEAIPDGPAESAGIAVGLAAADATIRLRLTDGSATPPLTDLLSPGGIGDYTSVFVILTCLIVSLAPLCTALRAE